ncbi:(2Fe-2S)-binding protein [Larkinella ripae]
MKARLTIEVNRKRHTVTVDPATPLLYVLRNNLQLNGPKYGCGLEQCGACMVLLDGKATPSCLMPVGTVKNKSVVTLEGLTQPDGTLHPVQRAFVEQQAAQCGYCLNGMVISAASLLAENRHPDETAIRQGMERVLCRCGTQSRILRAIRQAANESKP